jgi:hypothetical protein
MVTRRTGTVATLVVAGLCAVGGYALVKSSDESAGSQSARPGERPVAALQNVSAAPKLRLQAGDDGPKPGVFSRAARASDAPLAAIPELAKDVRRVATARRSGVEHAVFVGNDAKGMTCVFLQEAPLGRGGGGCNPSRNPFGGSPVMWSSSQYNEDPQKLVIFGVASDRVRALSLAFDGGARTAVQVSDDGGFVYVVTKPVIEPIDVPKQIITFASNGRELGRTDLGITFGP